MSQNYVCLSSYKWPSDWVAWDKAWKYCVIQYRYWLTDPMLFIDCIYILYIPKPLITLFTKQIFVYFKQ